jgi:Na+/H+ antiporter
LILSLIPVFPNISLDPTLVFLVVLPPLLYSSALQTSWREFRINLVQILLLAFGGVAFTVAGVALASHLLLPDFSLAAGAVLGAVVSATDAISASAIGRRVGLPQEMLDLIEAESLVNDAAGLLALQFSVAMVVSGTVPGFSSGVAELLLLIVGGVAAGLIVGSLVFLFQRPLRGSALQTLVGLATPYFAYLLGESFHASGVLATVTCGLYIGQKSSQAFTSEARLEADAVWKTIEFGLNGMVFILIGLQLPNVLDGMRPLHWPSLIAGAAFISMLVVALRMLWIYPAEAVSRKIRTRWLGQTLEPADSKKTFVVGWAGMRGVLTLAAALSLPDVTATGAPFPHRAGILFLAFAAILVSLTGQGLSLPWFIKKLKLGSSVWLMNEERSARRALATAALRSLEQTRLAIAGDGTAGQGKDAEMRTGFIERYYRQRLDALQENNEKRPAAVRQQADFATLTGKLRQVERDELMRLEQEGKIGGETLRKLERELDLLDMRFLVR